MRSGVLPAVWLLLNLHTRMIFRASAFILFLFFTTLSPNTVCEVLCILSLNVLKYITFLSLIYGSSPSISLHSFVLSILSLSLHSISLTLSIIHFINFLSFFIFPLSLNFVFLDHFPTLSRHFPGKHHPLRSEHRHRADGRPRVAVRGRSRRPPLGPHVRNEGRVPPDQENLVLRRFP